MKMHFATAKGSHFQRSLIAASMVEIEEEIVRRERERLPKEQQPVFMMTYECFVMWSLKRGFEAVIGAQETESAIETIRDHFATHAWYELGSFERIWASIQAEMPSSLTPKGQFGIIYPIADMVVAANLAGFSFEVPTDYVFGVHVIQRIKLLADFGRDLAEEHVTATQKG